MELKYDIREIMKRLPHRYPFLLIDRILELEPEKRIVALKNVTINEPFFQGHFPETPIMPGVLIIEAMAQTGGLLVVESFSLEKDGSLFYFTGMDKVRFRKPVTPGDQLRLEVELLKVRSKVAKMSGTAYVEKNVAVQAELMVAIRPMDG